MQYQKLFPVLILLFCTCSNSITKPEVERYIPHSIYVEIYYKSDSTAMRSCSLQLQYFKDNYLIQTWKRTDENGKARFYISDSEVEGIHFKLYAMLRTRAAFIKSGFITSAVCDTVIKYLNY